MNNRKLQKKGVSLAVLVLTISILLVLLSTVIFSYSNVKNATRKKEFATEVYSLEKLIAEYHLRNNKYPTTSYKVTIKIADIKEENRYQFTDESGYSTGTIQLREIDLYEAGVEEITRGKKEQQNDMYVLSEETGKVYYLKGERIGEQVYYTITSELKKQIGM